MKIAFVPFAATAMLTVSFLVGCGGDDKASGTAGKPAAPSTPAAPKHAAHGAGPHEGAVADWGGGKFHVEFTVDHGKQEATVFVLGSDEKSAAPIKSKDGKLLLSIAQPAFQVDLIAAPEAGESGGAASKYVGKHEKLGIVQEFSGTISGDVEGTPYVGEFKEEPHK